MDVLGHILERARTEPDRPAAKDASQDLTYSALTKQVADLASGLSERGVGAGDRVALHLPNSVDFLVSTLSCMWLGAIFVPLARADPPSRLSTILADADPVLVLTSAEGASDAAPENPYGSLPSITPRAAASELAPPERRTEEDRPAYCIYTSGTTGRPKGVLVGHRAFACAVLEAARLMELRPETRALCVSPFHFDGSYGTLFPVPVSGGSLLIPHHESLLLPRMFFKFLDDERINHTSCSPSYLRLLLSSPLMTKLPGTLLKTMALGGEACSAADLESLWSAAPELRVFNRYGPTETAIAVTTSEVTPEMLARGPLVPIGRPHAGVTFHLVDPNGNLIDSAGEVGELYIGGSQLMIGYWRDPELTATVLREDVVPGEALYKTGDLVYRDDWGDYVYVDRADRVVKRRAVRISLAEIAHALRRLPGISAAVCLPFDQEGQLAIAAFVVAKAPLTELEVRRHALGLLPSTMVPDVFQVIDAIPMTSGSKVDERALLAGAGLVALSAS